MGPNLKSYTNVNSLEMLKPKTEQNKIQDNIFVNKGQQTIQLKTRIALMASTLVISAWWWQLQAATEGKEQCPPTIGY